MLLRRFGLLPTLLSGLACVGAGALPAQCANQWLPGSGLPGTNGPVYALTRWDPDGPGPAPDLLVLGGSFQIAGTAAADHIAAWDPATDTWSALGSGLNGAVYAFTTLPTGELVAAGSFTIAGGVAANNVAKWNGAAWTALGSGLSDIVFALATLPNGNVVAGGYALISGGIAQWNGSAWTSLGSVTSGSGVPAVVSLAVLSNGDLVAGGIFAAAGGTASNNIARWNGTSWSAMGAGANNVVNALLALPGGALVAGGRFTTMGGIAVSRLANWNGTAWSAMGSGASAEVTALARSPSGAVVAGGLGAFFQTNACAGTWNGTSWSPLVGHNTWLGALAVLANGDVVAGASVGGVVKRWSAAVGWTTLGAPRSDAPAVLLVLANGDIVAAGRFGNGLGVARWNGSAWSLLGTANDSVLALAQLLNGELVAGGLFTSIGTTTASRVARWNGSSWSPLGSGIQGPVLALTVSGTGELVAGGSFAVGGAARAAARWNGSSWLPMGSGMGWTSGTFPPEEPSITSLATLANGDVVATGRFDSAGGVPAQFLARWNGASWSSILPGFSGVNTLVALPNGDFLAGGDFQFAGSVPVNGLARWNGTTWSGVGGGVGGGASLGIKALALLPDGDLLAGGTFTTAGGVPANHIARWNGSSWSPLGSGTDGRVDHLAFVPSGLAIASGQFMQVDGQVSAWFARLATTCPVSSTPLGAGCASSGGSNTLAIAMPAWLGGTFHSRASGLPATCTVAALIGFTPVNVPLTSLFGEAVPGCNGYVTPDLLQLLAGANGSVDFTAGVPRAASLVGIPFGHQLLSFELDQGQNSIALTSTNAFALTIGVF